MIDDIDLKILDVLQSKGRISFTQLSEKCNLSITSTAERVKKLEDKKIISGYSAQIDINKISNFLIVFITVTLDRPIAKSQFSLEIEKQDMIKECYHIAGEGSYLLKVICHNIEELENLINKNLKGILGVTKTVTTLVLSTEKDESKFNFNKVKI